jgi:hypothetical protein
MEGGGLMGVFLFFFLEWDEYDWVDILREVLDWATSQLLSVCSTLLIHLKS